MRGVTYPTTPLQVAEMRLAAADAERQDAIQSTAAATEAATRDRLMADIEQTRQELFAEITGLLSESLEQRTATLARDLCAAKLSEKDILTQLTALQSRYASVAAAAASLRAVVQSHQTAASAQQQQQLQLAASGAARQEACQQSCHAFAAFHFLYF